MLGSKAQDRFKSKGCGLASPIGAEFGSLLAHEFTEWGDNMIANIVRRLSSVKASGDLLLVPQGSGSELVCDGSGGLVVAKQLS